MSPFDLAAELKSHVAALALVLAAAGCALEAAAQTLPEAVRQALRRNPEVLAAAANARASVALYEQAGAGRFPTIDLRAGVGRETSENVGLQLSGRDSRTLQRE